MITHLSHTMLGHVLHAILPLFPLKAWMMIFTLCLQIAHQQACERQKVASPEDIA